MSASPRVPPVPAVLRLVQLVVLGRLRASGKDLYREVAEVTGVGPGKELLVSGCGEGVTAEWLAKRTGASVTGVDANAERIERADANARALTVPLPLSFQHAPLDDLPHESSVFDAAVGEPALASASDAERAVAELARVTKPLGTVVLLQLTWSADLTPHAREMLVERLGMRPHLLVEWKQMMRDAGLVDIQVQDWTDAGKDAAASAARRSSGTGRAVKSSRSTAAKPKPANREDGQLAGGDTSAGLTWPQKVQIVGRAWRQYGWRAARGAVERETALLRELARERALGFQLITGVKWPYPREGA